jgi:multiple sugar transport system substrate-binding protein
MKPKNLTKTSWGIFTCIVLLAMLMTACGPAATPPPAATEAMPAAEEPVALRITTWSSNEAHMNLLNGIADEYRQTHPNVSVKFEPIPFGDYVSKLTVQLAGSNPPDAGWIVDSTAPTFIQAGVMMDLRPTLENFEGYDLADYAEGPMKLWVSGDAIYGVPFSTSPYIIFYNIDMFNAAGVDTPDKLLEQDKWTWDELRAAAKTIKEKTGNYGFESYDGQIYRERMWNTMGSVMKAFGGQAWNDAGTQCTFNQPGAVAAFQFIHDMTFIDKSHVPPGEVADFFSGLSAMQLAQLSRTAKLTDATFKWDIAPLPSGPAGYQPTSGQAAFVVFNNSPNKEVAADFIAFMTNKDNVAKLAQFFPPARKSVLDSDAFLNSNPLVSPESMKKAVADSILTGTVEAVHPEFPKIDLAARAEIDNLWVPDADVQAVMDKTCEAIQPLMLAP